MEQAGNVTLRDRAGQVWVIEVMLGQTTHDLTEQGRTMNHIEAYLEQTSAELDADGFDRYRTGWSGRYDVTSAVIDEYEAVLNSATREAPLQEFLAEHPAMLVGEFGAQCR
ncbi:hypothetical protein ACWF0M_12405 [Kribbella sp. NPDC055110]